MRRHRRDAEESDRFGLDGQGIDAGTVHGVNGVVPRRPSISVYMSVHNAGPYLDECVESILRQSEPDLEFLIVDDASTDGSRAVLQRWAGRDDRIKLIENERPLGLIGGLNLVVGAARASLCARMDADDVAHPDRLRRQRAVLDADPSVALVGALSKEIDSKGQPLRPRDRWRLIGPHRVPPFAHATVMFRRALFHELGGYRETTWLWEDADLCYRMARRGRVMVVPEALYFYRIHPGSTTLQHTQTAVAVARMLDTVPETTRNGHLRGGDEAGIGTGVCESAATLYYVGASRLWAGLTPPFVGSLRELRWLPPSTAALKVLALATWGRWSPSSLRTVLRCCIRLRDAAAGLWLAKGAAVEWRSE